MEEITNTVWKFIIGMHVFVMILGIQAEIGYLVQDHSPIGIIGIVCLVGVDISISYQVVKKLYE